VDFCVSDSTSTASDTESLLDYLVGNYSSAAFYVVTRLSDCRQVLH
jgi:hypothetical protein